MCIRYILPLFPSFILLILSGCKKNDAAFQRQLDEAEVLMRTNADSAFRQLCALDSEAEKQSKELQMRHLLLRCNAQNKADSLFSSDSLGLELTRYYADHGTFNQRMLAHYMLGCAYRDMNDYLAFQKCLNEAIAATDTSATDCDFYQLSIIYGQLGALCYNRYLPKEALEAYGWAEHYATLVQDTLGILNIWANKANVYIFQDSLRKSLELKEKTVHELMRGGYRQEAAQTMGGCARLLSECGEVERAKAYLDDYILHSGYFREYAPARPIEGHESACYNIATYYLANHQLDSAEYYLRQWQPAAISLDDRFSITTLFTELFEQTGPSDSLARYALESRHLASDIHFERNDSLFQQYQAYYNVSRYEQLALRRTIEAQKAQIKLMWAAIAALLFFILCIAISVKYQQIKKNLQDIKQKFDKNQQELDKNLRQLGKLHKRVQDYERKEQGRKAADEQKRMHANLAVQRMKELAKKPNTPPTDADWEAFQEAAEEICPKLAELRQRCNLSGDNYKICMLLKLGFDLSEISNLTGLDSNNLNSKRRRLYKRIHDKEGSPQKLDLYIRRL